MAYYTKDFSFGYFDNSGQRQRLKAFDKMRVDRKAVLCFAFHAKTIKGRNSLTFMIASEEKHMRRKLGTDIIYIQDSATVMAICVVEKEIEMMMIIIMRHLLEPS